MKNDLLSQLWSRQGHDFTIDDSNTIVHKAKKQRRGQYITIAILTITVLTLLVFALYVVEQWNDFTLGLTFMISSLVFRVFLEFITLYQKESQLVSLDNKSFRTYLKKYYQQRLGINYFITPICFALYVIGFLKLLPYFKQEFSQGFYTYIVISGAVSLLLLLGIIANSIVKEHRFLAELNRK